MAFSVFRKISMRISKTQPSISGVVRVDRAGDQSSFLLHFRVSGKGLADSHELTPVNFLVFWPSVLPFVRGSRAQKASRVGISARRVTRRHRRGLTRPIVHVNGREHRRSRRSEVFERASIPGGSGNVRFVYGGGFGRDDCDRTRGVPTR